MDRTGYELLLRFFGGHRGGHPVLSGLRLVEPTPRRGTHAHATVFRNCRIRGGPVSEDLFERGLCLPSGTQMTEEDLDRIVKTIRGCSKSVK